MNTENLASGGAVHLGEKRPQPPLSTAEAPLVEESKLYPVSIEDMVDFDRSSQLSPEVREVLINTPWLGTAVFPMAAKCFWRLSHGVGTAELFTTSLREGALEKTGFTYEPEELTATIRGLIAHDLGTAYINFPDPVLNPIRLEGRLVGEPMEEMRRHPGLSREALARFPSTQLERKLVGGHHFFGDHYGVDPHGEDAERDELLTDGKLVVVSLIDNGEAMTNLHRRYHTSRGVDETRGTLRKKFHDKIEPSLRLSPNLIDFIARRSYEQRRFEVKGTRKMEAFNNSLRDENQDLWDRPDDLVEAFVNF